MKTKGIFLLFAGLFLASCGSDHTIVGSSGRANESYTEHLNQTVDGVGARRLFAETINGGITVTGGQGDRVTVQIRKKVKASSRAEAEGFARQVEVRVEHSGDEIRVVNSHPKFPKYVQVEVEYEIQAPARLNLQLRTLNGGVSVRSMDGDVRARTTNGGIQLSEGRGQLDLTTLNGDVNARVAILSDEGRFQTTNGPIVVRVEKGNAPLVASTTNGAVDVTLPNDFSGQLDARTVNGRVQSSFSISRPAGSPQNRLAGPLGEGGTSMVRLRAVNGSVNVSKL